MLKNDSFVCGVVHEEIDTTTIRVNFKIMKGGDGRAAVVQPAASGASVSAESNVTACASDSSNAPPGSYKPMVLKNDSCACVVVHEEIVKVEVYYTYNINSNFSFFDPNYMFIQILYYYTSSFITYPQHQAADQHQYLSHGDHQAVRRPRFVLISKL